MIHAYYRFYSDRPEYHESEMKGAKDDPTFMSDLPAEEAHLAKQIYDKMVDSVLEYPEYERAKDQTKYYDENKNIKLFLVGADGFLYDCILEFGDVEEWCEYENASHIFYAHATMLKSVKLRKETEEEYHESIGLTKKFEGTVYNAGSSMGDMEEEYSCDKLSPEFYDLLWIRNGKSPKVEREALVAQRKAEIEEAKRREEEEKAAQQELEEGKAQAEIEKYYDKKYGQVVSLRSIARKQNRQK